MCVLCFLTWCVFLSPLALSSHPPAQSVQNIHTGTRYQVEYHVGSGDIDAVMGKCAAIGTYFMSFSPLCGPCHYVPANSLIDGDLVTEIASHYPNVTGSQVSLRWIVQQALPDQPGFRPFVAGVIPKSDTASHIAANIDLFGFSLTQADMDTLTAATAPKATPGDCACP